MPKQQQRASIKGGHKSCNRSMPDEGSLIILCHLRKSVLQGLGPDKSVRLIKLHYIPSGYLFNVDLLIVFPSES